LSETQKHKLKQLSLLTLASPFLDSGNDLNQLDYPTLMTALDLQSPADLETLVKDCTYAGLLSARLSPTSAPPVVHVYTVAPIRDLRPESLPVILQILSTWSERCDSVVSDLDSAIISLKSNAQDRSSLAQKRQKAVDQSVVQTGHDDKKANRERGQRGSKRDLDDDLEISDGEGMDMDEGIGESTAHSSAPGGSRGTKRNRPRG
jgi:COP9 signalosome complex subunit 7